MQMGLNSALTVKGGGGECQKFYLTAKVPNLNFGPSPVRENRGRKHASLCGGICGGGWEGTGSIMAKQWNERARRDERKGVGRQPSSGFRNGQNASSICPLRLIITTPSLTDKRLSNRLLTGLVWSLAGRGLVPGLVTLRRKGRELGYIRPRPTVLLAKALELASVVAGCCVMGIGRGDWKKSALTFSCAD